MTHTPKPNAVSRVGSDAERGAQGTTPSLDLAPAPPAPPGLVAARVLAWIVAGNGFFGPREVDVLERAGAFDALGVDRAAFTALVAQRLAEIGGAVQEHSWLPAAIETSFDADLDAVADAGQRALVHRLARLACAVDAEHGLALRMLTDHLQARWCMPCDPGDVAPAPPPAAG